MKYMNFNNQVLPLSRNLFQLLVRITIGFAMLSHGFPKLQTLLEGGDIQFFRFLGLSSTISLGLTVFAEFVCSIFLILGLFTRYATFFLAFTMAIAALIIHGSDAFEKQEMSVLYLCIYLLLMVFGTGKYSIDFLIERGKNKDSY